jgi:hypothetical protein
MRQNKAVNVKRCDCKHAYQDKRYGKSRRLHNPNTKGQMVCTVCAKAK